MRPRASRKRLDILLVEQGLAGSPQEAQASILAGEVFVNGLAVQKAGTPVPTDAHIELRSRRLKYASRGGLKLEGALQDFSINPAGLVCLDIGASHGGFTDCLLQHGAARVYSVDVNVAQLDWNLQKNPRVTAIQRNARDLNPDDLPEPVELVVADVSFISVCKVLAPAFLCAKPNAYFLILIKPQFELPREDVGPGGIVADVLLQEKSIAAVQKCAVASGLLCGKVLPSRLTGAEGNQEFFLHARKPLLK